MEKPVNGHFCFYFPAKNDEIATENLRMQDQIWILRRKIVKSSNYNYGYNNVSVLLQLERPVSSERVDIHIVLHVWKDGQFFQTFSKTDSITTGYYNIDVPILKYSNNTSTYYSSSDTSVIQDSNMYNTICRGGVSLKGIIFVMDSFKTDNKFEVCEKVSPKKLSTSSRLSKDFASLLDSHASSDVVLQCAGKMFQVHKCILGARSPVFAAMFRNKTAEPEDTTITWSGTPKSKKAGKQQQNNNGTKDATAKDTTAKDAIAKDPNETQINSVHIMDVKPDILSRVLKYIYSGKIDDMTAEVAGDLLSAAHKYQLPLLKEICVNKIKTTLSVKNVLDALVVGDLYDRGLKAHAMDFICKYPSLSELKKTDKWTLLQKTNPTMVIEVLTSVVGYLQDSKTAKH